VRLGAWDWVLGLGVHYFRVSATAGQPVGGGRQRGIREQQWRHHWSSGGGRRLDGVGKGASRATTMGARGATACTSGESWTVGRGQPRGAEGGLESGWVDGNGGEKKKIGYKENELI
jgi:hypothetical protein